MMQANFSGVEEPEQTSVLLVPERGEIGSVGIPSGVYDQATVAKALGCREARKVTGVMELVLTQEKVYRYEVWVDSEAACKPENMINSPACLLVHPLSQDMGMILMGKALVISKDPKNPHLTSHDWRNLKNALLEDDTLLNRNIMQHDATRGYFWFD